MSTEHKKPMSSDNGSSIFPSISRRRFVQGAAALGALSAVGTPLLGRGALAAEPKKDTLTGCHWGAFRGHVEDGRFTKITPWEGDKYPSPQLAGVRDSVYSPSRIKYPMVRRAWLEHGPGADPSGRGTDDFVRVSWDKAVELVANELVRVKEKYGPTGIYGGSYGWKSPGKMHNCQTLLRRLLNLNGGFTNSSGDYSTGAAQVILPYVVGSIEVYEQCTTWPVVAEHTELMVFWGSNPLRNSEICWGVADHGSYAGVDLLKDAGTKSICIDPMYTETAQRLESEWIKPRPQTDVAMMLGIAHTLYTEGLHDQKFLDKYTSGFELFLPYLLGKDDGQPKTAEWASTICGVAPETLKDLARRFAKNRTMLALGYSTQRQQHGEQIHWMLITLASMLGQIGLPGGGYGLSYHYASGGAPTHLAPSLPAISDTPGAVAPSGGPAWLAGGGAATIPVSRFVETLLNPGKTMDFNGGQITLPLIKLAYWVGGNPFSHQQHRNQMVEAWKQLDTFIVHDFQWTATARHADIVLPATTSYERDDISVIGDYAMSHILAMKKVIDPVFEAKSDYDIFTAIAQKMGQGYTYPEGKRPIDWIRGFYDAAKIESRARGMEMPVFEAFWESNEALAFPLPEANKNYVRYADYRKDPLLNALGTATGKIEVYSHDIAKMKYDNCPPHPTWMEPVERLDGPSAASKKYPFHVAAIHPISRLHSQLCGTVLRESYAVQGREPCWMNPADAKARNLKDGDLVRVFNDRGQILAGLVVTDVIMPGVIRINEGGWYDPVDPRTPGSLDSYGDVNNLTVGISTSKLAQSNCGQTGNAEVEKFEGVPPKVTVFTAPKG